MRHQVVKVNRAVNALIKETIQARTSQHQPILCGCGCGQLITPKPSPVFVQGHDSKLKAVYRQLITGQTNWVSIPLETRKQLNRKKAMELKKQMAVAHTAH